MAKKANQKRIAFQRGVTATEKLPLSHVYFPGHYGTFFAFTESKGAPLFLCSCSLAALENYVHFRLKEGIDRNTDPRPLVDSMHFPMRLVNELMAKDIENNSSVLKHLRFEDKLCHECNRATPTYRYCHEMYGGVFKQTYGWYINKQAYEYGINGHQVARSICPQEILDLIEISPDFFSSHYQALQEQDFEMAREFEKAYRKQVRLIQKVVENEVRRKFGHKKIGEAWTSETILYYIIRKHLPNREILRHYRPDFLEGLELDIYIPDFKVGIEYQGIQHYKPVKHWGGKEALERNKQRDARKRELCNTLGIDLVYFRYDEGLSNVFVMRRLEKYL